MEMFIGIKPRNIAPKETIQWLSDQQKDEYRFLIDMYQDVYMNLTRGQQIDMEDPMDMLSQEEKVFMMGKVSQGIIEHDALKWSEFARNQLDTIDKEYQALLIAMAPHCLYAYHESMNRHELPTAAHHRLFIDNLMKVEKGELGTLLIASPAGSAKTSYTSRSFVQWYMGRNPSKLVLAVGNSQNFVENQISKPNRESMKLDTYHAIFPDVAIDPQARAAEYWKLDKPHRGAYKCVGAGGAVAGQRADLLMGDDLFKQAQDAMSETIRSRVKSWVAGDLMSRLKPNGAMVFVNTIFHSEDAISHLIDQARKQQKTGDNTLPAPTQVIRLEAECTDKERDPLGREVGEYIWPEFYPEKHWETLKANLSAMQWSCIYQNRPADLAGDNVGEEDFVMYDLYPETGEDFEGPQTLKTIATVDTATRATERSDYTVITVFRQGMDKVWYTVDMWREQKGLAAIAKQLMIMNGDWDLNYIAVEAAGMGFQLIDEYQGKLGAPIAEVVVQGKGSKEFRAEKIFPYIKSGLIQFPKNKHWMQETKKELIGFPSSKYDDIVDTFSVLVDHEFAYAGGGTRKLVI